MPLGVDGAALGADVIVIEPPAGAAGRRLEPFLDDLPGIERSLTWQALNRNKRAITLDLASIDGQQLFAQLADQCDVAIDSLDSRNGAAPLDGFALPEKVIRTRISAFAANGLRSTVVFSYSARCRCGTTARAAAPSSPNAASDSTASWMSVRRKVCCA